MKILRPKYVILIGVVIIIASYIYDLQFAGLPYPDPTPEMLSDWKFHKAVASYIGLVGLVVSALGCVLGFVNVFRRNG